MDVRGGPSDQEVVARVLGGDREAFGLVIRRYETGLVRFATRMLGSRDAAADAVAESLMRAYRHLASCRDPSRLRTWLYRIVANRCKSYLARRHVGDVALDGEISRDSLPPELRGTVDRLETVAALLASAPAAAGLEARVMAALRRPAPPGAGARRLVRWLTTPHPVTFRIRPAWSLALAAAVALLTLVPTQEAGPVLGEHEGIAQFVGRFPDARSVHVVGSFNDWRTGSIPLEDQDHDGVWRTVIVLPAGAYEYMFVVDGERWVPDRLAERSVEDDFGGENSILIVRAVRR